MGFTTITTIKQQLVKPDTVIVKDYFYYIMPTYFFELP